MAMLEKRTALVTGAAGGIGSALTAGLLAEGAAVIAVDLNVGALEKLRQGSEQSARLTTIAGNITDEVDSARIANEVGKAFDQVDILVNCAGFFPPCAFEKMTFADWRRIMAVNLDGVFLMTSAILPFMKKSGFGRIVNIGSSSYFQGTPNYVHYVAAKAGVIGFTRSLAREVGIYGITANVVAPGLTSTQFVLDSTTDAFLENRRMQRSIQRHQYPNDVVGTILFLCSGNADFVSGQTIVVDGGAVFN
jgi:NAD(P)-dependent dehydrogenase (short-subunit alcohol dehydrogenase family)